MPEVEERRKGWVLHENLLTQQELTDVSVQINCVGGLLAPLTNVAITDSFWTGEVIAGKNFVLIAAGISNPIPLPGSVLLLGTGLWLASILFLVSDGIRAAGVLTNGGDGQKHTRTALFLPQIPTKGSRLIVGVRVGVFNAFQGRFTAFYVELPHLV